MPTKVIIEQLTYAHLNKIYPHWSVIRRPQSKGTLCLGLVCNCFKHQLLQMVIYICHVAFAMPSSSGTPANFTCFKSSLYHPHSSFLWSVDFSSSKLRYLLIF